VTLFHNVYFCDYGNFVIIILSCLVFAFPSFLLIILNIPLRYFAVDTEVTDEVSFS